MLEGAKIIPHWENASWDENQGSAPVKPSYFRRSLSYICNKKEEYKMERTNSMCMLSIDSNPNPFDKMIHLRRTMSLGNVNLKSTASRSSFQGASV